MSVVTTVLEKLRGKRQEQIKSVWTQYHELVIALAEDREVDVDELAIVMDQLDLSDANLEADIANQRDRKLIAQQYSELQRIKAELPKLEQAHERARVAFNEAVSRLDPAVQAAWEALNNAQNRSLQLSSSEAKLISTCRDPEILDKQREVQTKREQLHVQLKDDPTDMDLKQQLDDLNRQAAHLTQRMLLV